MAYKTQGYIRLSTDSNSDCGFVYVNDVTSYPLAGGQVRAAIGLALFWSVDDFVNVKGYDIGNGDDWYLDADDNVAFQLKVYAADLWAAASTFDATTYRVIVFYGTSFYMQTTNGAVSSEPGTLAGDSDWALLEIGQTDPVSGGTIDDDEELYAVFEEAFLTQGRDIGVSMSYITTNCPIYVLEKQSCHNWRLSDKSGATVTVSEIKLSTYAGLLLDDELTFADGVCDVNLKVYTGGDDGVYYLEVWGQESGDTENQLKAKLIIYDFCNAWKCYKELFRFVLCKCVNPCQTTDCDEQHNIVERKYDLDMILGLLGIIEKYVYYDKWKYIGVLSVQEDRNDYVSQVGQMIDKLKIVVNRCGKCGSTETNDITC